MANFYLLNCPECNHENQVEPRQAGQEQNCEGCEKPMVIPKLGDLKKLPLADEQGAAFGKSDSSSRMSRVLFSFGLLLLVLAGAAGTGLYLYADLALEHPIDLEREIEMNNAVYDQLQAHQLWDEWHGYIAGSDLGEWREDPKIRYNKQAAILKNFSYGIFGLSAIGLIMMISSMFLSKKK